MSSPSDRDPPRWREAPSLGSSVEAEIGAASRSIAVDPGPDELRVAHLRQRALQRAAALGLPGRRVSAGGSWGWAGWARTAAIVVVSLLLGGVATAVTGRLIQRYRAVKVAPVAARADVVARDLAPGRHRRWRVSIKAPTDLDLSIGPDGAEVAVVDGQASMSGAGISGAVDVVPGRSWREGTAPVAAPAPPPAASPATSPVPPSRPVAVPAPSEPAPAGHAARATLALVEAPPARPPGRASLPRRPEIGELPAVGASSSLVIRAPQPSLVEPPPLAPPPLPTRLPSPGSAAVPEVRPRPAPVSVVGEATLVARALGRLRRDHDPMWALTELEEHKRRFPRGELRREVALARAEALLAMDRKGEALVVLDTLPLGGGPTERPAALARAELRADEGRRGEAIGDFDRVIGGDASDDLAERALFGRALCHLRGGDLGGARADLRAHLHRFPSSARRAEVEKLIDRLEN